MSRTQPDPDYFDVGREDLPPDVVAAREWEKRRARLRLIREVSFVAGIVMVTAGGWMVYSPLAFLLPGTILLLLAIRRPPAQQPPSGDE